MQNKTNEINAILGIDDIYKAPDALLNILLDNPKKKAVFKQFLELNDNKLDFDYFHEYFQDEAAERKKQKQDFTPKSVSNIISQLIKSDIEDGTYFEAAAGTGGMMIAKWTRDKTNPNYKPSDYFYVCEELSDRAFPFLVFNMAIRGLNGLAIHCNSLIRECYGIFFIRNYDDNPSGCSSIVITPYSIEAEKYYNVKFVQEKYQHYIGSELRLS